MLFLQLSAWDYNRYHYVKYSNRIDKGIGLKSDSYTSFSTLDSWRDKHSPVGSFRLEIIL